MGKHSDIVGAAARPARVLPKYLSETIGRPSLLETEVAADYDNLLFRLAETVDPRTAVEWIWIADVADLVWEMRRFRDMRARIIERETTRGLGDFLREILDTDPYIVDVEREKDILVEHWNSGDSNRRRNVLKFLEARGVDLSDIHAVIYYKHLDKFAKVEALITNLGRRRDSVLREIERRRDNIARRLRDMTDAEFEN